MAQSPSGSTRQGFHGTMGSLPLVDLLQVWSMNGFSGLITVTSRNRSCQLYFVDGDVVHAELDALSGEAAVKAILRWSDGAFELYPNTTTLHRTIEKKLSHLLLDAHREIDEMNRGASASRAVVPPADTPTPPVRGGTPRGVLDQLRGIRGVTAVVRFGADGRPAGATTPASEGLAARGLYLALAHASAVADAFGLHDLSVASLGGALDAMVVIHSGGQYLALAVAPDVVVDSVVAQVRALFARSVSRPS